MAAQRSTSIRFNRSANFLGEAGLGQNGTIAVMNKVVAFVSLGAVGLAVAGASMGMTGSTVAESELTTRKSMFAEILRRDGATATPELLCTARNVSDETARIVYEAVLMGRARVRAGAGDAVSADLVDTFVQECRGNPRELELVMEQRGPDGLYQMFAGAMALAGR